MYDQSTYVHIPKCMYNFLVSMYAYMYACSYVNAWIFLCLLVRILSWRMSILSSRMCIFSSSPSIQTYMPTGRRSKTCPPWAGRERVQPISQVTPNTLFLAPPLHRGRVGGAHASSVICLCIYVHVCICAIACKIVHMPEKGVCVWVCVYTYVCNCLRVVQKTHYPHSYIT